LAKTATDYINLDYSNSEQVQELIDKLQIDYIVPGCNDLSYQVCAKLHSDKKFYGIDSPEITEKIHNKERFRELAIQIGLPVPRLFSADIKNEIWPLIIKPVNAYSGRGISIVHKTEQHELGSAIKLAEKFSRTKKYIVEEYIKGQLHSHSAFIVDGKIVVDFIVEECCIANPFVVDTSRVIYDFPLEILNRIRDAVTLMARKMSLTDGLIHTQFIKNKEHFWLIEITRRCPGDLYSQLIELSTGFNYAENYARPYINQKYSFRKNTVKQSWIMRHVITQPTEGIFESVQFKLPIHIEKMVPLALAGDTVKASPFSKIGILFIKSDSKECLDSTYNKALTRDLYTIN